MSASLRLNISETKEGKPKLHYCDLLWICFNRRIISKSRAYARVTTLSANSPTNRQQISNGVWAIIAGYFSLGAHRKVPKGELNDHVIVTMTPRDPMTP